MSGLTRQKQNDVAVLRAFYRNEVQELTPHQEVVRKRYLQVQSMLSKGSPTFEIVSVLEKDYKVSSAQAYRDIRNATNLYGDLRKAEKEGIRWILYDMVMEDYQDARGEGDRKAANAAMKNLITIAGVDREDPELPDFGKLQPPPIVLLFSEEMERQIAATEGKGVVDLTELFLQKNAVEDAEYEVLNPTGAKEKDSKASRDRGK